jgi:hypothetical protein
MASYSLTLRIKSNGQFQLRIFQCLLKFGMVHSRITYSNSININNAEGCLSPLEWPIFGDYNLGV